MSDADAIRVIVVDDQQVVREGLVALLELAEGVEVVGDTGDGESAVALLSEVDINVVLMDLRMPVMDGVGATREIVRRHPKVAVGRGANMGTPSGVLSGHAG